MKKCDVQRQNCETKYQQLSTCNEIVMRIEVEIAALWSKIRLAVAVSTTLIAIFIVSVGKDFAAVTSKYAQGLFRYSTDVGTNRLTFIGLYPSETGAYLIAAYVQNGKLMIQYRHNAANPVFDTQQAFPVNTLKRLEVNVKIGAGTGEVHAWLDGVEVANIVNVNNADVGNIAYAKMGAVFGDANLPAVIVDGDDFVLGDSYIALVHRLLENSAVAFGALVAIAICRSFGITVGPFWFSCSQSF